MRKEVSGLAKKKPVRKAESFDYVPEELWPLMQPIDSLVIDPNNLKDHGEADLPSHAASLKSFGIRRLVVVQRKNRRIEAGNGTVMAAKSNGWTHVPVLFMDDDDDRAKAFAAADNMVATLALWNEDRLKNQMTEIGGLLAEFDLDGLLQATLAGCGLGELLDGVEEPEIPDEEPAGDDEQIELSHKVTVTLKDEDAQVKFLAEMIKRGYDAKLSTGQVRKRE